MPPGWDGIETTARIWEIDPSLQVVLCTAYSDYALGEIVAKLGHSDRFVILKKPFDIMEVQQLANAFTAKWSLLQQARARARELREREMMELQLRQAQKLEAIGQLAAGIAHEINTPTQYVGDNTRFLQTSFQSLQQVLKAHEELLQAAKQNAVTPELIARTEQTSTDCDLAYLFEQMPEAIHESLEGIERISEIVRAMKEFSHPGGKEKSAADLNKAIESTVTVARNEWKYVADVKLELDPQLPPVPCFLGEFNQAILNLVINASHAIDDAAKQRPPGKGTITVRTRRDGDHVEVRVSDTGAGIPEAIRTRMFEPFFTTKPVGKGTGQGLSMIYGTIVKRHGGTVTFESEVGKGTTFILRLPIVPPHGEPALPAPQTDAPRTLPVLEGVS